MYVPGEHGLHFRINLGIQLRKKEKNIGIGDFLRATQNKKKKVMESVCLNVCMYGYVVDAAVICLLKTPLEKSESLWMPRIFTEAILSSPLPCEYTGGHMYVCMYVCMYQ